MPWHPTVAVNDTATVGCHRLMQDGRHILVEGNVIGGASIGDATSPHIANHILSIVFLVSGAHEVGQLFQRRSTNGVSGQSLPQTGPAHCPGECVVRARARTQRCVGSGHPDSAPFSWTLLLRMDLSPRKLESVPRRHSFQVHATLNQDAVDVCLLVCSSNQAEQTNGTVLHKCGRERSTAHK